MPIKTLIVFGLIICAATSACAADADACKTCAACKKTTQLVGADFSAWRGGTGTWTIVRDAALDPDNPQKLIGEKGSGALLNGPDGRTKHLVSKEEWGDVRAQIEFMVPQGSNSGVYLMGRYEIQVLDSWGEDHPKYSDCGGIYQRWDDSKPEGERGYEGHPPAVNASKKPGEWQKFDICFRAPRFDENGKKTAKAAFVKVMHNGQKVHGYTELTGPTRSALFNDETDKGPIMLQGDHGPVAYRVVSITPMDFSDTIK